MAALAVNSSLHQFGVIGAPVDNAFMHKKRRTTPLGKLMDAFRMPGATEPGITDNELARRTGSRQSTITRIAQGKTKNPNEESLKPIAEFFGVSTAALRGTEPLKADGKAADAGQVPRDLTPEALYLARTWMQLSPGRRAKFLEDISWAKFFERKFPPYRIGISHIASYDKFERGVEADWEKMMRQAKLPLE